MRHNRKVLFLGARGIAACVVLCALIIFVCGCGGGIEAAPTPAMTEALPTTAHEYRQPVPPNASESGETAGLAEITQTPATARAPSDNAVFMRGVWIASVLNIDFPSTIDDEEAQKAEFREILDNTESWGLDTVFVQVRPMGDAMYPSELNPWSSFLTGAQGRDPGWDPLKYMISEAHDRGISFHAWLNPYRVLHPGSGLTVADFADGNIAKEHPEWLITHESYVYLDPAREEVKQHVTETVKEIVNNYDVDGIHFDDYFYPADYPLPDGAERDGFLDMERRTNINDMLRRVKNVCMDADHPVVFGVSPFGVWKNSSSDPAGSDTTANESYYSMAADSVRWIKEGLVDYIAPQLYWPIGHDRADYDTLAHWWAEQVEGTDVSLVIGQGIYQDEVADEIKTELEMNAEIPQITGSIFFSYSDLADRQDVADAVRTFYEENPSAGEPLGASQTNQSAEDVLQTEEQDESGSGSGTTGPHEAAASESAESQSA